MEPEMVSTTVDNAPAFLQLRDKYKQELVEDTRLTKAADLAAKHGNDLNSKPRGVNYAIGPKSTPTVWCPGQWRASRGRPCHVPRQGRF